MEAIKIEKRIDSEILHIPELKRFMGKKIEIILLEMASNDKPVPKQDLKPFISAAGCIDIDEKAVQRLREKSMV